MQQVQSTAMRAYRRLLANQPLTPGKVAFAWALAAGPALGRAGTPTYAEASRTLVVRARDAAWLQEIRRARPVLAERLNQLLGADAIRRVVIE
jgi:hypothetical protein